MYTRHQVTSGPKYRGVPRLQGSCNRACKDPLEAGCEQFNLQLTTNYELLGIQQASLSQTLMKGHGARNKCKRFNY
jgi:hypothetical protein